MANGGPTSPALLIISAMITPALLILGSGSLIATCLLRLARVVDRARVLLNMTEEERKRTNLSDTKLAEWLASSAKRSLVAERAMTALFLAVGSFVIDGFAIALDFQSGYTLTWLPVGITVTGMLLILFAAYLMLVESKLAGQQIRDEILRPREVHPTDVSKLAIRKQFVKKHFDDFVNKKDAEAVRRNMTATFVDHDGPGGAVVGISEDEAMMRAMYEKMPDIKVTVEDILAEGDKVLCKNRWTWTDPSTSKPMEFHGFVLWRFEGDKIAERWATVTPPHPAS